MGDGGEDPLDGISVYRARRHWHFVSYGLSELYDKESDEPDVSGFGKFELTFACARGDEAEPPAWAVDFLQNLARYVFETGNVFEANHQFDLGGPIARGKDDRGARGGVRTRPGAPPITTPFGRVDFLQIVGVTRDEHASSQGLGDRAASGRAGRGRSAVDDRSEAALSPVLQAAAMRSAPSDPDGASGLYVTAFQIGIMAGSLLGGLLYEQGGAALMVGASAAAVAIALGAVAATRSLFGIRPGNQQEVTFDTPSR